MRRGLKIVLFTLAGIGLLFIVLVAFVLFEIFRPQPEHHVSKEAQLSNGGILRVHGLEYNGPHGVPYFWDASYQTASGATKETVGIWGGGSVDGDVIGCPIGDLVVVNPLLSRDFFVRTAAGRLLPNPCAPQKSKISTQFRCNNLTSAQDPAPRGFLRTTRLLARQG